MRGKTNSGPLVVGISLGGFLSTRTCYQRILKHTAHRPTKRPPQSASAERFFSLTHSCHITREDVHWTADGRLLDAEYDSDRPNPLLPSYRTSTELPLNCHLIPQAPLPQVHWRETCVGERILDH